MSKGGTGPIVVLTGAGIFRESGLHTFRDPDGIWATTRIEDVATPEAFRRDPERVHAFYNARRRQLRDPAVQPNPDHGALARLEREWPDDVLVVTQNIDDLHERGGSKAVIYMHGEILKARCAGCGAVTPWSDDLSTDLVCGGCSAAGGMRPDVVWFGEMPLAMAEIEDALAGCALFLSIGTSGAVYPAAGFVSMVRAGGRAHTAALNLEPSDGHSQFAEAVLGPAATVVPAYVDRLLADGVPG
jgi:NAD-dependent deacetylase